MNMLNEATTKKGEYGNFIHVDIQVMQVSFDNTLSQVELLCPGVKIHKDKFNMEQEIIVGKLVSLGETPTS